MKRGYTMTGRPTHSKRTCFTLVELLTVIAIIGVLIGIVMGLMSLASSKMAAAQTQGTIKQICVALENYKAKYGYYLQAPTACAFYLDYISPSTAVGNTTDVSCNFAQFLPSLNISTVSGAYYINAKNLQLSGTQSPSNLYMFVDGYGYPIIYRCPGWFNRNGYDIGSVGQDGCWGDKNGSPAGPAFSSSGISAADTAPLITGTYQAYFGLGDDMTNFKR